MNAEIERGDYATYSQIRRIIKLVDANRVPDGTYSDIECRIWELLRSWKER